MSEDKEIKNETVNAEGVDKTTANEENCNEQEVELTAEEKLQKELDEATAETNDESTENQQDNE